MSAQACSRVLALQEGSFILILQGGLIEISGEGRLQLVTSLKWGPHCSRPSIISLWLGKRLKL
eukprot:10518507-Karenia_brevis.AAC.1